MSTTQVFRYPLFEGSDGESALEELRENGICERLIELPTDAKVLSIGMSTKGLIFWAAVDVDNAATEHRTFVICGNGKTLDFDTWSAKMGYIGTLKEIGGPTLHVFEGVKVEAGS